MSDDTHIEGVLMPTLAIYHITLSSHIIRVTLISISHRCHDGAELRHGAVRVRLHPRAELYVQETQLYNYSENLILCHLGEWPKWHKSLKLSYATKGKFCEDPMETGPK